MDHAVAQSRLDAAFKLVERCRLCPRQCGARRLRGETGYCAAGRHAETFAHYVHWGEDAILAPAQTVYLRGCNLSCSFCQTREEGKSSPGEVLTPALFRRIVEDGARAGAKSVDILGGEPGVNLHALLEIFAAGDDFPGLVWNSNLYISREACQLLDGVVDLFLADVKFGGPACAAAMAGRADATAVAWKRAGEIYARSPQALVLRHLVVPGHFACCTRPVLERIAKTFSGIPVSLKTVFLPPRDMPGDGAEKRFLAPVEAERAVDLARDLGLRLTEDPAPPEATAAARRPGEEFEIALSAAGHVYLKHATAEAVTALRAALGKDPDGSGNVTAP